MLIVGCRDYDADAILSEHVRVPLAFTFSTTTAGNQTRQAIAALDGKGRGVTVQRIIPMKGDLPDGSEVSQEVGPVDKPNGESPTAKFYHYEYCDMKPGANRCLVYGAAASVDDDKAENGSLVTPDFPATIWSKSVLNGFRFSLESIYDKTEAPADGDAWKLANALSAIANIKDEHNNYWKNSANPILLNLFKNFTNHGFNLPCSAASVRQWIDALASAAASYLPPNTVPSTITDADRRILNLVKTKADEAKADLSVKESTYPRNEGLPDGAAVLRWTEWTENAVKQEGFVPEMQTTTLDNINSVSRFAYPAALYYFVDSKLSTSETKVDFDAVYRSENVWADVLSAHFKDGTSVSTNTKAVALTDPVQYAVARLEVKIQSDASLKDAKGAVISVGSTGFPLKGIIVCGQRPVNYLFEQPDNSDADVKFAYDPVNTDIYLSTTLQEADTMLVLQSGHKEDVDIILEFENNCGEAFKCIDGTVYPGTRFYLIGKVAWTATPEGTKDNNNKDYVFTKDYTTTVNLKVKSLAKAYNVLPNLLTNNLEIGVETTPDWVASTPIDVRLDE